METTVAHTSEGASYGYSAVDCLRWRRRVRAALRAGTPTPFYLFAAEPMARAVGELERAFGGAGFQVPVGDVVAERTGAGGDGVGVRQWYSCKTQPAAPVLAWWREQGRPVEVVSEFEFLAALRAGFPTGRILVNGPAKDRWLPRHPVPGLRVNFDSGREAAELSSLARRLKWRVGIRCLTSEENDPESPGLATQFGMERGEAVRVLRQLLRQGLRVEQVHVHLRTNVAEASVYGRALGEVAAICRAAEFRPRFVDCGGGFPPPHTRTKSGRAYDRRFALAGAASELKRALAAFPGVEELWLENGRFLTARSGVLAVRVLEVKERRGLRQLICDGGRTMNALLSIWEDHALLSVPRRGGTRVPTAVYGPTCMAFDQLARRALPAGLRIGDALVWMDAGAYHLPWETRFSHGHAAVVWDDGTTLRLVRSAEGFEAWWGSWVEGRGPGRTVAGAS